MRCLTAIVLWASSAAIFAQPAPDVRAARTAPGAAATNAAASSARASRPANDREPGPLDEAARRAEVDALEPAAGVRPSRERAPAGAAAAASARVDRVDLGTTSITGNQELPKVLYIVPWKRSDLGDLVGRPVNTLLDEVLSPVDPDVFKRHLEYYDELFEPAPEADAGASDRKE